jgi:hypothetical protein
LASRQFSQINCCVQVNALIEARYRSLLFRIPCGWATNRLEPRNLKGVNEVLRERDLLFSGAFLRAFASVVAQAYLCVEGDDELQEVMDDGVGVRFVLWHGVGAGSE